MVDSVSFRPAKPVHGSRVLLPMDFARPGQSNAGQVTTAPRNLSLAAALAQKGPPFDADKVASLRAAIASGAYKIDLGAVADGMIRFGGGDLG
jgi:flagellar biosynthesis anti-sigma factor FlgM